MRIRARKCRIESTVKCCATNRRALIPCEEDEKSKRFKNHFQRARYTKPITQNKSMCQIQIAKTTDRTQQQKWVVLRTLHTDGRCVRRQINLEVRLSCNDDDNIVKRLRLFDTIDHSCFFDKPADVVVASFDLGNCVVMLR
jgi:hypothetical protein